MTAYSKYFEKIRIRPERSRAQAESDAPCCQWDGCDQPGHYRAPVGRMKEGAYFRFCIDHVREYNRNYNYFSGLGDNEVARFQKEALTGHRPTWRIGGSDDTQPAADFSPLRSGRAGYYARLRDPLGLFGAAGRPEPAPQRRKLRPLEAGAIETLGLEEDATGADITARYKALVKRHHPDANGGDRGSEERFRDVVQAYRLLKRAGLC